VEKLNADNKSWCTSSMKSFATVVNYERTVIGLRALRIEEKLSDAATGHSSDMASKGFFAHESPVPNKKTPWDRAALGNLTAMPLEKTSLWDRQIFKPLTTVGLVQTDIALSCLAMGRTAPASVSQASIGQ
jgi:hypothetical protein